MNLRLIMLGALTPLMCLLALVMAQDIRAFSQKAQAQTHLEQTALHAEVVGDLVHELQKERGYSAGFTASKGAGFVTEITDQRASTDLALGAMSGAVQDLTELQPEVMGQALSALDNLADHRAQISALELTVPQLAGYYTGIINAFLEISTRIRTGVAIDETAVLMEAQQFVSLAKEAAGLERAMGATGLGADRFPDAVHQRFTNLAARQGAYLARAGLILERPDFVTDLNATPAAQTAQEMRSAILDLAYGGAPVSFTAPEWFAASTNWIDLLRTSESALGQQLLSATSQARDTAQNQMWQALALIAVGFMAAIGLAVFLIERVTGKLRHLITIMNEFIRGNFEAWVPFKDQKGEIGTMAEAIYRFKQLSKEAIRQKDADEASLNARHQKVVDLVTEGLNALSQANLTLRFDAPLSEEYDAIRTDFNLTVDNLRSVMGEISATVQDLEVRAEHMMSSASDLSQRTHQQVSQIEGTVGVSGRLSQAVQTTNAAIEEAKKMTGEAKGRADQSGATVAAAVAAMDRISDSSGKIGQITTMIEDLSFQTNLLALNAGVEAARAGASGKGFAVVATEVRALAGRSAEAAMEIKTLIGENVDEIKGGVQLVDRTGEELQSIIDQILRIDVSLAQVNEAAQEQSKDLDSLEASMGELRTLTGQNLSLADQSQSSSDKLAGVAQSLTQVVSGFCLEHSEGPVCQKKDAA